MAQYKFLLYIYSSLLSTNTYNIPCPSCNAVLIESVKRSVRNLIQLNLYEKPFHPEIDGCVTRHLFGLSSAHTKYDIERAIGICLTNYEPRVQVNKISVTEDLGRNGFNITIVFTVVNSPEPIEVSLYLERVR